MKLPIYLLALSCALLHAQGGSLTPPPGSPAPTMKSLDQVEARTPLVEGATGVNIDPGTGGITITASGSYYLTGNLSVTGGNGITIGANNVSLDLNNFTISSNASPSAGNGIFSANDQLTITNGRITGNFNIGNMTGSGFANGIEAPGSKTTTISRISVFNVSGNGINTPHENDNFTVVESCHVDSVGETGIIGDKVKSCVVSNCTTGGIKAFHASDCRARTSGGIAISSNHVSNCNAQSDDGVAISGYHVVDSTAHSNNSDAIKALSVSSCHASSFGGTGIDATELVTHSRGSTTSVAPGHFGIKTQTAVGCSASSVSATNKYNMP